jgi:hypothetical protein
MALTSRNDDQMNIRLPKGMREFIAAAAGKNNRSMNAEIVARLESSFGAKDPSYEELLQDLKETAETLRKRLKELDQIISDQKLRRIRFADNL